MDLKSIVGDIAKLAPAVGTAILGPWGGIVGNLIAEKFGVTSVNDIQTIINSDPAAAEKLAEVQALLPLQTYQTEVDDRKSARQRETEMAKSNNRDWVPSVIAVAFVVIYIIIQYFTLNHPGNGDDIISARVQDIMIMICAYYFGASHKHKDSNNEKM